MNYASGIEYMKNLCSSGRPGSFMPDPSFPELLVFYPGYKNNGDYRLELSGTPPTHMQVCTFLYENIQSGRYDYNSLKTLLEDIYYNGLDLTYDRYNIPNVVHLSTLLYWITLQDEVNYPSPKFQGRRMPLSRYFEAIYCAANTCTFSIKDVTSRCNNNGYRPSPYKISDPPAFYY